MDLFLACGQRDVGNKGADGHFIKQGNAGSMGWGGWGVGVDLFLACYYKLGTDLLMG